MYIHIENGKLNFDRILFDSSFYYQFFLPMLRWRFFYLLQRYQGERLLKQYFCTKEITINLQVANTIYRWFYDIKWLFITVPKFLKDFSYCRLGFRRESFCCRLTIKYWENISMVYILQNFKLASLVSEHVLDVNYYKPGVIIILFLLGQTFWGRERCLFSLLFCFVFFFLLLNQEINGLVLVLTA